MKKIISYTVIFLKLHPVLMRMTLNIVCRFPELEAKLKRLKAGLPIKQGKGFWHTIMMDGVKWFFRRSKIQKLLTKMLSIISSMERKLQKLIIINIESKVIKIPTGENQIQKMASLSPYARRIYYDLEKANLEKLNEAM